MNIKMSKNIVLLKAAADNLTGDSYISLLSASGFSVFPIPPIDFEFFNLELLSGRLLKPFEYSGVILSSPRCVKALSQTKADLIAWANVPAFVVGKATDEAAKALGLNTHGEESGNAERLAEIILEGTYAKPLLYPKGSLASDTLESRLASGGVATDSLEIYRTIPHPDLDAQVRNMEKILPAKLVFFSPSGVDNLLPLLLRHQVSLDLLEFYAIGLTTEKALISSGLPVMGTAAKPTPAALLEALVSST